MKEKLTELLIKMGWKVTGTAICNDLVVEKRIEPIAGLVMENELPAVGKNFICYRLETSTFTYHLFEREFEHIYNSLKNLYFNNEN